MNFPGEGFARRVTRLTLDLFGSYLQKQGEGSTTREGHSTGQEGEIGKVEDTEAGSLFGGRHIRVSLPFGARGPSGRRGREKVSKPEAPAARGKLAWKKKLSLTDAQRQIGNPTGDLRLTQARFKVRGHVIDQTTYFREEVFAEGDWAAVSSRVEVAEFAFDVTILGRHYGVQRLLVSHKPTGEAQQGNYTSGIRWGAEMGRVLAEEVDVSGAMFRLYSPDTTRGGPFVIDVSPEAD